ncbi:unnamed protein product [Leptosia nina]|uniref:Uncharacterized protein n=1 Tax=Leptosia nina TaxID=320188 RepID=A0AAV1JX77_9NEOP
MEDFIQSIKQKFSMENIIETIRDELDDTKKPKIEETKVDDKQHSTKEPDALLNIKQSVENFMEKEPRIPVEPKSEELKKPSNIQKKQPSNVGMNILQKPNPPEEVNDPYRDNENLFSFCD